MKTPVPFWGLKDSKTDGLVLYLKEREHTPKVSYLAISYDLLRTYDIVQYTYV